MPEVNDYQLHLQGVTDLLLQRSSGNNQGCFSRCLSCVSGVKSEFFNGCLECREHLQDGKPSDAKAAAAPLPPLFDLAASFWGATSLEHHTPPTPIGVTVPDNHVPVPFAARVTKPRSPTSSRDPHHLIGARSPTSPYRTLNSQRGRPPNGSRRGPKGFTGVRQRKGVRGYLVEIRPSRWRRTIWLGTYNTDREAAGAYDAGVFYTKKKTKLNFPALEGTFPPLPNELRLDNANDADEIKTFVQHQARLASQKVKNFAPAVAAVPAESSATSVVMEQCEPAVCATSASGSSSDDCDATTSTSELVMQMDEDWLQSLDELMGGNVSFPPMPWQMNPFDLKDL